MPSPSPRPSTRIDLGAACKDDLARLERVFGVDSPSRLVRSALKLAVEHVDAIVAQGPSAELALVRRFARVNGAIPHGGNDRVIDRLGRRTRRSA